MSQLIPFQFDTATVRVVVIESGESLFVAKDVATALGYADAAQAVKDHCKKAVNYTNGDKTVVNEIKELHRTKSLIIPESDVYRLTMRSKLERAEQFQDWVCEEVLPSIRKTGSYQHNANWLLNPIPNSITAEKFAEGRQAITEMQATLTTMTENLKKAQVICVMSGEDLFNMPKAKRALQTEILGNEAESYRGRAGRCNYGYKSWTDPERALLRQYYESNLSNYEIAQKLDRSVYSVEAQLKKVKKQIRVEMEMKAVVK